MKIAIVSMCSEIYRDLGEITGSLWSRYAKLYGYDTHVQLPVEEDKDANWTRISKIRGLLQTYDLVLAVGADVVVTNKAMTIEKIWMNQCDGRNICISSDVYGPNCDAMLFKKNPITDMFLYAVETIGYDMFKDHIWAEQEAIIRFISQAPYKNNSIVVPQDVMNSYLHEEYSRPREWPGQWKPDSWLLHLPGLSLERRIELAEEYSRVSGL